MKRTLVSRRQVLGAVAAGAAGLSSPMISLGRYASLAGSPRKYSARTLELVDASRNVDLKHALTLHPTVLKAWLTQPDAFGAEERALFRSTKLKFMQTTLETVPDTLLDFAWHNGFVASHGDLFYRVNGSADLTRAADETRIGIIFGCENSEHFGTLDDVDRYFALGQRVSQLTYNSQNGSVPDPRIVSMAA